jgi:hypothetical protein
MAVVESNPATAIAAQIDRQTRRLGIPVGMSISAKIISVI